MLTLTDKCLHSKQLRSLRVTQRVHTESGYFERATENEATSADLPWISLAVLLAGVGLVRHCPQHQDLVLAALGSSTLLRAFLSGNLILQVHNQ